MTKTKRPEPRYYHGERDGSVFVTTPGDREPLDPRFELRNHSPTGYSWGYGGSGPAQLALALVADVLCDDERALQLYQEFKSRFVSRLPYGKSWGPLTADELLLDLAEIEAEGGPGNLA